MKSGDGPARGAVSPCLLVESVEDELEFLKAVFDATVYEGQQHAESPWQVEVRLGDTTLKIGRADEDALQTTSVIYVWTNDVDRTYARAMNAGAAMISKPNDQPWGVREASFRGPQGNIWWIGRRIGKMSNREVEEKLRRQRQSRM